jgi:hypothetical protein
VLRRKPKAPAPLSPERQALAVVIQRVVDARAAIAKAEATRSEAGDKIDAAAAQLARVERDREKACDEAAEFVRAQIAGDAGEPLSLRRRKSFDQRAAEAERKIETWRQVRDATFTVEAEQRRELVSAGEAVSAAVTAVLISEAGTVAEPMMARLEALEAEAKAIRAALHEVNQKVGLGTELRGRIAKALGRYGGGPTWAMSDFQPNGHDRQPEVVLVTTMLGRLRDDPVAPLPTLDQVRRVADVA